ncbi:unnamed protein product [Ostreobium quekettii]|uniref:protein-serine/threonine phosphatase n=1 Tax=Ostreobium quekettii TaxID=121088 RepID=A0A8S1J3B8_9CHLO|nr:unnamed protein product [Ostreobium quekettii]|eukprot:evm.model.scf_478.3 EVM.evm.TU.scf_478.3   scf_478:46119-51322(-)
MRDSGVGGLAAPLGMILGKGDCDQPVVAGLGRRDADFDAGPLGDTPIIGLATTMEGFLPIALTRRRETLFTTEWTGGQHKEDKEEEEGKNGEKRQAGRSPRPSVGGLRLEIQSERRGAALIAPPGVGTACSQGGRAAMEDAGAVVHDLIEFPLAFQSGERVVPPALEADLAGLWEAPLDGGNAVDWVPGPRGEVAACEKGGKEEGKWASSGLNLAGKGRAQEEVRCLASGGEAGDEERSLFGEERAEDDGQYLACRGRARDDGTNLAGKGRAGADGQLAREAEMATVGDCMPGCGSPRSPLVEIPSERSEGGGEAGEAVRRVMTRFHFAGVYDGHGGGLVARAVAENLHVHLRKALDAGLEASVPRLHAGPTTQVAQGSRFCWAPGPALPRAEHPGLGLPQVACAIHSAFRLMDGQLMEEGVAEDMGTTAVVGLVSESHLCVANCGDSRAVLSRGGMAYRLTRDHKPDLEDEQERINSCGGVVLNFNGVRVMGLLAMSRALGDHCLRDVGVIAYPEVTIVGRQPGDEFLVLATDGLWDALADREACDVARKCFQRVEERGAGAKIAARLLVRAALERGSTDNVTVTVVDLHGQPQV